MSWQNAQRQSQIGSVYGAVRRGIGPKTAQPVKYTASTARRRAPEWLWRMPCFQASPRQGEETADKKAIVTRNMPRQGQSRVVRCLQINLNRCREAQVLLGQTAIEKGLDLLIVAEPTKSLTTSEHGLYTDTRRDEAIKVTKADVTRIGN